jgi:membrane glycosyltransferase
MLIGLLTALACWEASALVVAWMSPVILGLVFSGPLSWLTSRPAGPFLRRVLSTRDGRSPPAIVESAQRASGEWASAIAAGMPSEPIAMVDTPRAA